MKKIITLCIAVFAFAATTQTIHAQDKKEAVLEEQSKDLVTELQSEFNFTENQAAVVQRAFSSYEKAERELRENKANMTSLEIKDYQKRMRRNFESVISEVLTEDEYIQVKKWYKEKNKR